MQGNELEDWKCEVCSSGQTRRNFCAILGIKEGCWALELRMKLPWRIVTVHCTFPRNKITSLRAETMHCAAQTRPGEAELLSWEDFLKMAKCGREVNS